MKLRARWNEMDLFRRGLLLLLAVAIPLFAVVTAVQCSRVGIEYGNAFLRRTEKDGVIQYAGRKSGEDSVFTVGPDDRVEYRWGEETYGPYQVKRDPTARPPYDPENPWPSGQIGVEVRREGTVVFRGGYASPGRMLNDYWSRGLVWEDGTDYDDWTPGIYATTSTGEIIGLTGSAANRTVHQPQLYTVIQVAMGPRLSQRGNWTDYIKATALAVFTVLYVLLYKQLLQARVNRLVKDGEQAQPSDVSVAAALVAMLLLTGATLLCYLLPLTKLTPV